MTSESAGLPPGWCLGTVADLTGHRRGALVDGPFGSKLKTAHYTDSGPRVIRLQNVGDGEFIDAEAHIADEHFEQLQRHEARAGDVIVALLGTTLPRACVIPDSVGPAIVKADCPRLRVEDQIVSAKYAMYALNSDQVRRQAKKNVHGVGRPRLNLKNLRLLEVPLAPRPEQDLIVEAIETQFSRLEAAEGTLQQVRASLELYRASVLQAAVEGRLVPTEAELARKEGRDYEPASVLLERMLQERHRRWEEAELAEMREKGKEPKGDKWKAKYKEPEEPATSELPDLPDGWAWSTVDALSEMQGGLAKGKKRGPEDRVRGVPYLRVANVQRGHLDLTEVKEIPATEDEIQRLALRPGDVLFNEGGDRDKLGRGWIWRGELRECIHQNHVFRARLLTADVLPKFLSWYGNSIGQAYFLAQGKQTTNLASISLSKMRSLPVPIPPFAEQCRIAEQVEDLLSVEAALAQSVGKSLKRCTRLREAILKGAFEGKLVDQDASDEPASVTLDRVRGRREMPRRRVDPAQLAEGAGA